MPADAQSERNIVRDAIVGARLGSGYAGLLNLAATPDISAANYRVSDDVGTPFKIDILRVPYESRLFTLSRNAELSWRVAGAFLTAKEDFVDSLFGTGSISSKWSSYDLTGGLLAKIQVGSGFTLVPGLDFSVARLDNEAEYSGGTTALQPLLDGLLFNWHTDAYLVTPNIGLEWKFARPERRVSIVGHVAWSWISSFDASDPALKFNETVGVYSIRADYAAPTRMSVFERPLDGVVRAGYAGFFGANREALGFTSVAEVGAGVEVPISANAEISRRIRLTASYLFGPNITGWAVGLGVRY
jgi:hypothetical protein